MAEEVTQKEDWMNAKWRPMMGWMYMLVCTMDFVAFPIFWSLLQAMNGGRVETQWSPITLQGAGLFHMAMGAIIGVAAFGRTQEKLAGVNNGGSTTTSGFTTPSTPQTGFSAPTGNFSPPATTPSSFGGGSFGGTPPAPATGGVNSNSGFGAATTPTLTPSGKKIVPDLQQPEI
jgi:hypothetical protein